MRSMTFKVTTFRSHFPDVISDLILWKPTHGSVKPCRPFKTCTKQLTLDTEYEFKDLHNAMSKRKVWWSQVSMVWITSPI